MGHRDIRIVRTAMPARMCGAEAVWVPQESVILVDDTLTEAQHDEAVIGLVLLLLDRAAVARARYRLLAHL